MPAGAQIFHAHGNLPRGERVQATIGRRMSPRTATAYPWNALQRVSRVATRGASRARRHVEAMLDLGRLSSALSELTECEAVVVVQRITTEAPRRRPAAELAFELGGDGLACTLWVEPELIATALAHMLRRPIALSVPGALDESLNGAAHALLLELARRCGAKAPLHLTGPNSNPALHSEVFVEATVVLGGSAHAVQAALRLPELPAAPHVALVDLGETVISVPLVIGWSLAERADLADLVPGNAWFPGAGCWLDASLSGNVALAAPSLDQGSAAALSPNGTIVIRGGCVPLLPDAGELMTDSANAEASLNDAVLDSPVVVRVEMGAVSMTAREWAELGPGDIIETGRRIGEPIVLRIAGREVARGELVNLEGELGVRVRELVRP